MASQYSEAWDYYVQKHFDQVRTPASQYPGDEWGDPNWWEYVYQRLLSGAGSDHWKHVLEIGPGSGKYTTMLLDRTDCHVLAVDVSSEFLAVLNARANSHCLSGRLETALIRGERADELLLEVDQRNLRRNLDAVISIDAMVHVDLQFLIAYIITSALSLKIGGKLVLTLADATSDRGARKLLEDVGLYYPLQGKPSFKFEYISPDITRHVLALCGYRVIELGHDSEEPGMQRDMFVIAELVEDRTEELLPYLAAGS